MDDRNIQAHDYTNIIYNIYIVFCGIGYGYAKPAKPDNPDSGSKLASKMTEFVYHSGLEREMEKRYRLGWSLYVWEKMYGAEQNFE